MSDQKTAEEISQLTIGKYMASMGVPGSDNHQEIMRHLIVEALKFYLLQESKPLLEALQQTPCPKCENGDGIDGHEGAGCYKRIAIDDFQKKHGVA